MRSIFLMMFAGLFLVACGSSKGLSEKKLNELNYQQAERFALQERPLPDQYPMYPNGGLGFVKDMKQEQVYPPSLKARGLKGTVQVEFVVDKSGKVKDIVVKESLHPTLDAEAIRVIKTLNKWHPAQLNGKPVDCKMGTPFYFDPAEE